MAHDLPQIGRAAVLIDPYGDPYIFTDRPVSAPGLNEALIRLDFSGVCHGDVYSRDGGPPAPPKPRRPLVGGHEGIGEILAIGPGSSEAFKIGDTVGVAWRSSVCGECQACEDGWENFCGKQVITGMQRDGTYQRYITFPLSQLHSIPAGLDAASACPLLCAGITAYSSLNLLITTPPTSSSPPPWLAISGAAGALGHLAIQYGKAMGLNVVAIDGGGKGDEKEKFCLEMGADAYVDFAKGGIVDAVRGVTGGGAMYVLMLSPHQGSYDDAGEFARFGARIMAIGIGGCHMPLRPLLQKAVTILSNQTGTKEDMQAAFKMSAEGKVKCRVEVMELKKLNWALDLVKAGRVLGKLVVDLRD